MMNPDPTPRGRLLTLASALAAAALRRLREEAPERLGDVAGSASGRASPAVRTLTTAGVSVSASRTHG